MTALYRCDACGTVSSARALDMYIGIGVKRFDGHVCTTCVPSQERLNLDVAKDGTTTPSAAFTELVARIAKRLVNGE